MNQPAPYQPQDQLRQQKKTPEVPAAVQKPQLSIFDELGNSIKACNTSNCVHKSNVRYLLDNINQALDGPKMK